MAVTHPVGGLRFSTGNRRSCDRVLAANASAAGSHNRRWSPDGRYDQLARALADKLEKRLGISVNVRQTHGSLENLRSLQEGEAEFGLYQSETKVILKNASGSSATTALFVANIYPEYLIPVALADGSLDMMQLNNRSVACNDLLSGDHAMLRLLLDHLGHGRELQTKMIPYLALPAAL